MSSAMANNEDKQKNPTMQLKAKQKLPWQAVHTWSSAIPRSPDLRRSSMYVARYDAHRESVLMKSSKACGRREREEEDGPKTVHKKVRGR